MRKLRPILLASFFFSLHLALVAYINSSMLGSIISPKAVSIVFAISAACSLLLVGKAARLVERWGAMRYMATVLGLSALLLVLLGLSADHWSAVLVFIPYFALNVLVYYGFDVFLEHFSDPKTTGNTRGIFLTLNNLAWVGMPALVGFLESSYGFSVVYFFAAFATIAALATIFIGERRYKDPVYVHLSFSKMFDVLRTPSDVRSSIIIYGLLEFFYAWMVVYSPLYLVRTLGYSWETVGVIFSVMLLPFILFQYPAGRLADKFSNERELISGGLMITGVATIIFALVGAVTPIAIALILFLTRVGASIVGVSNESYFFKHVTEQDAPTIAVFRNMASLAYVIGPILGFLFLGWNLYVVLFFILGILMLAGSLFALTLHDIKRTT